MGRLIYGQVSRSSNKNEIILLLLLCFFFATLQRHIVPRVYDYIHTHMMYVYISSLKRTYRHAMGVKDIGIVALCA